MLQHKSKVTHDIFDMVKSTPTSRGYTQRMKCISTNQMNANTN